MLHGVTGIQCIHGWHSYGPQFTALLQVSYRVASLGR